MTKNPFDYQAPKAKQTESIQTVRTACKMLHRALLNEVPPGRERSLAITKLEEVSMWANKGIVFADDDEVIDQAALDAYVSTPEATESPEIDLPRHSATKSDK